MRWSVKTARSISGSPRASWEQRFIDDESTRAPAAAQAAELAEIDSPAGPGRRARLGPAVPRDRPRNRLLRGCQRRCRAEAVERIRHAHARARACTAKVSSIHVNGWFGRYDKLATARRLFTERFGVDLGAENRPWSCRRFAERRRRCSAFSTIRSAWRTMRRFPDLRARST